VDQDTVTLAIEERHQFSEISFGLELKRLIVEVTPNYNDVQLFGK